MNRRTIHFAGHVQGVGFRYTAQSLAMQYAVSGFVRNMPDGRVQMIMEGEDAEMDRVLKAIEERMEGFIRETRVDQTPANGQFKGFTIEH